MSKKLGELLKAARTLMDVSLREVENKTDISNAYLSQLESGSIREPSPHKLNRLAKFYGLNYSDLMAAAGYASDVAKPTSVSAMLLASQNLTEAEARSAAAYIKFMREQEKTSSRKS